MMVQAQKSKRWGETTVPHLQMMDTNCAKITDKDIPQILPLVEAPTSYSAILVATGSHLRLGANHLKANPLVTQAAAMCSLPHYGTPYIHVCSLAATQAGKDSALCHRTHQPGMQQMRVLTPPMEPHHHIASRQQTGCQKCPLHSIQQSLQTTQLIQLLDLKSPQDCKSAIFILGGFFYRSYLEVNHWVGLT